MIRKIVNFAVLVTLALAFPFITYAGECESLFSSRVRKFNGPVRIAYKTGGFVPFDVQHELLRLSEIDENASLGNQTATGLLPRTSKQARQVFTFTGKTHTAELLVFRSPMGVWIIRSTTTSSMTGQTKKLAADVTLAEPPDSDKVDSYLAIHMRAIRDLFRRERALDRADLIRPILDWVKASGESPLTGNLVELFLASRRERFYLDRGFEKDASTDLSASDRKKMSAIAFLVQKHLTFVPGGRRAEAPGIFRQVDRDKWIRISASDHKPPEDQTTLLFEAMTNAGFEYDSATESWVG